MKIGIFTVGEEAFGFQFRLAPALEERFLYGFEIQSNLLASAGAFNAVKKQYFAPALLSRVKSAFPADIKYGLGLTRVDLYGMSLNYVFGEAAAEERAALVSTARLRPEFYGHAASSKTVFDRVLKESMHQLAHVLGSKHCYNQACVLFYLNNIYDIDKKTSLFCSECEKKLKKTAALDRAGG